MEWDDATHITTQHDGMAQHDFAWDYMISITKQHDDIALHGVAWNGTK